MLYSSSRILSAVFCLVSSALSLSVKYHALQYRASSNTTALPPSEDPWYTAPKDLFSYPTGSIIRVRPDPLDFFAAIGTNITSASYNILYRTTDGNHLPSFAVTTLFIPALKGNRSTSGLLSYQIPYNTAGVDNSPSYTLVSQLSAVLPDIAAALEQGWYVSVTDFEGPNATFAVGVSEGHAVLDGLRAVTKSPSSPAAAHHTWEHSWKIGLWGYSGGSIASEYAAELQATYAPEIEIAGVPIGGLPVSVLAVYDAVNEYPYAGLSVLALWGYSHAFPVVESYLLSRIKPEALANFTAGRYMSSTEAFETYADLDIYSFFIGGRSDIASSPLIQYFLQTQGTMGVHGLPSMPMFIYKAIDDQLAPIQTTDALVDKYCAAGRAAEGRNQPGVNILYERNTIGGHIAEEYNADASAFTFLVQAINGNLGGWPNGLGHGCVVKNVTVGTDTLPDW